MDLNIGAALWLATKAEGPTQIFGPHGKRSALQSYKSLARIVLVGERLTDRVSKDAEGRSNPCWTYIRVHVPFARLEILELGSGKG